MVCMESASATITDSNWTFLDLNETFVHNSLFIVHALVF